MVTRGVNISLSAKLQKEYSKRTNKKERLAATSSLKIEKLRATPATDEPILNWQTSTTPSTESKLEE